MTKDKNLGEFKWDWDWKIGVESGRSKW